MKLRLLLCGYLSLIAFVPMSVWPKSPTSPTETGAQDKKLRSEEQSSKVKRQVEKRGAGEQSKVKIILKDRTEVKGYISRIDADSFQVTNKKTAQTRSISYADVEKVRGAGLPTGAKIAIAVVAAGAIAGGLAATLPMD